MKKYFSFVLLMLVTAVFGFVGCGDIYENVQISVPETEVVLYLNSDDETKQSSTTITATISGIDNSSVSNKMGVVFDDPYVASAGEFTYDGNNGTVTINAQKDGSTYMRVASLDNSSRVVSNPIKITVIEEVKKISVDEKVTIKKANVARGSTLNLSQLGNINFTPQTTGQTDLEFCFYTVINGTISPAKFADNTRLEIVQDEDTKDYILKARADASLGTVSVLVKSKYANGYNNSNFIDFFDVMVYDEFESKDIKVQNVSDGEIDFIDNLTLIENFDLIQEGGTNYNKKTLAISVVDANENLIEDNIKYLVHESKTSQVGIIGKEQSVFAENEWIITGQDSGQTTYLITANVVDENGNVRVSRTREFDFNVIRVAKQITLETMDNKADFSVYGQNEAIYLNVFAEGNYNAGIYGSKVTATVAPTLIEDANLKLVLQKVKIKKETSTDFEVIDSDNQQELSDLEKYIILKDAEGSRLHFGDSIASGQEIFVSFDLGALGQNVLESFEIGFVANSGNNMPTFSAKLECLVCQSVGEIEAPEDEILVKVGDTKTLQFTAKNGVAYNSRFNFRLSNQDTVSLEVGSGPLGVSIKALKTGVNVLTVEEKDTFIQASVVIRVVEVSEYIWLSCLEGDGISQIIYDEDNPIYNDTSEQNNDIFTLKQVVVSAGQKINVKINKQPGSASLKEEDTKFSIDEASPQNIVLSMTKFSDTIQITTIHKEGETLVNVTVVYYKDIDGVITEQSTDFQFSVVAYLPISTFAWNTLGDKTTISEQIYDSDSLSILNQQTENVGYIILKPYLYTTSARKCEIKYNFSQNINGLTWSYVDENDTTKGIKIWANLGGSFQNVVVYASVDDYGTIYTINCNLNIVVPEQISRVEVLDYNEDIYLEAGATQADNYYSYEIKHILSPATAFDKSLSYVLYSDDDIFAVFNVTNKEVKTEFGAGFNQDNIPLNITLKDKKVFVNINSNFDANMFLNSYKIKVIPSALLNVPLTSESWQAKFNGSVFKDLNVVIGNGSEINPYRISTETDLFAINKKGGNKHYQLIDDVVLTKAWVPVQNFSGSLTSKQYSTEQINSFTISNLYFDLEFTENTNYEVGLFGLIATGAKIENIIIEYGASTLKIKEQSNISFGVLAGKNASANILNLNITPYLNSKILLENLDLKDVTISAGILFGENSGTAKNISGSANFNIGTISSASVVGGIVGLNEGSLTSDNNSLFSANILAEEASNIGGIAGKNNGAISNLDVQSNIVSNGGLNIGGAVGYNFGLLENLFVFPSVQGSGFVGGAVGRTENSSSITEVFVELAYDSSQASHSSVVGENFVGGFAGNILGEVKYCYVNSFVKLKVVPFSKELTSGEFYGDVLGKCTSEEQEVMIGGFAGKIGGENGTDLAKVQSCFANVKVGAYYSQTSGQFDVGGFAGKSHSESTNSYIQQSYAVTDICAVGFSMSNIGGFIGKIYANGNGRITEVYSVCGTETLGKGKGFLFADLSNNQNIKNNFAGTCSGASGIISGSYYADFNTSTSEGDNANTDAFGAMKRNYSELQKFGVNTSGVNTYDPNTYKDWSVPAWVNFEKSIGFNDSLPIIYNTQKNKWLFSGDVNFIRFNHKSFVMETESALPTFWTYSFINESDENGKNFDSDLRMVVVLENLKNKTLNLTDLISMQLDLNDELVKLKITSGNPDIIKIIQPSSGYSDTQLVFEKTGTAKITISSLRNSEIFGTFQICVISGFSNYELQNGAGQNINSNDTILITLGEETEIYPTLNSKTNHSGNFGVMYYMGQIINLDSDTIVYLKDEAVNLNWEYDNTLGGYKTFVDININEPHIIYGNGKQSEDTIMHATLFVNLHFYDGDVLNSYRMLFDGAGGVDFPAIEYKNQFKIKVLRGITDASLSRYSASVENSDDVPATLSIETDNLDEILTNINAYIKLYKDGEKISDVTPLLNQIGESSQFNIVFSFDKVQISEDVIENWKFEICKENGDIVKELNFKITWQPTSISKIDVLHYIEKSEYNIFVGENEATDEIGSGRQGVLKVVVSQDYSDYDYIVVSSSQAENDKVSFGHLIEVDNQLFASKQYSSYLDDGSIKISKENVKNSVYYLSTFISAGLKEGTEFLITINAYKNDGTLVKTQHKVLTSSFAPFVTLETESSGDLVARGSVYKIKVNGIAENSEIRFNLSGVNSSTDALKQILLVDENLQSPIFTGQNGSVSFDLSLYVGILAETQNGSFTINATVKSSKAGVAITTYTSLTLYLVDYMLTDISVKNAESGVLEAIIQNGYTPLELNYKLSLGTQTEAENNFKNFTGNNDLITFQVAYNQLIQEVEKDLGVVTAFGTIGSASKEGIWKFEDKKLSADDNYTNFYVGRLENYLGVKGKKEITLEFSVELARCYILDLESNIYQNNVSADFTNFEEYLENSTNMYSYNFNIAFINGSSADEPEQITTAQELANMAENGHYILMNDLTLTNWVPLKTKIGSLDGNGYVIYLNNFALTTTNDKGGKKSSLNVGLFEEISTYTDAKTKTTEATRLQNIIIDVSRTTWTDITGIANVNFGFLVGVNQGGIIYNCEIINTETNQGLILTDENYNNSWLKYYNSDKNKISLENYLYANTVFEYLKQQALDDDKASIVSTFVFVSSTVNGEVVNANIGGLVGDNSGYITNSRVGRIDDKIGVSTSTSYGLNLFAGGTLGGLVGRNSGGTISASYFANGSIVNMATTLNSGTITGGLVAYNNGFVNASYVEGVKYQSIPMVDFGVYYNVKINGTDYEIHINKWTGDGTVNLDGATKAVITENKFVLDDINFNINISSMELDYQLNSIRTQSGGIYFNGSVGGFVHSNFGRIENCYTNITISSSLGVGGFVYENVSENSQIKYSYSASKINSSSNINGPFTGVDRELNVLNGGKIIDCYYLQDEEIARSENEIAQSISKDLLCSEPANNLSGFVFDECGIWTTNSGINLPPKLYEADNISLSNREVLKDVSSETSLTYVSDLPGSETNPKLIYNVSTYNDVFNGISYVNSSFARVISDVDFGGNSPKSSATLTFKGNIQGNGMKFENLVLLSESSKVTYLGLFKELDEAFVANLSISINEITGTQSYAVGALAGKIQNSYVNNIEISATSDNSAISGYNITGGLAGLATSQNKISNITSSVSVFTTYDVTAGNKEVYYNSNSPVLQNNISYAGGVIGVITEEGGFENNKSVPRVVNCKTLGNVTINAENVGGVFGLVDTNVVVSGAKFVIENDAENLQKLEADNIAGGIVGENRGLVLYSYIAMEDEIQKSFDTNLSYTGNIAEQIPLFTGSPKVIGGLVGLNVGTSGTNVKNQTGGIEFSYSRADVCNANAQVAGGLVGLLITNTNELSGGIDALISKTELLEYQSQTTTGFSSSFGDISGYINSVYSTGKVEAKNVAGGFAGILTAPVSLIYSNSATSILPSSVISQNFEGSIVGKILYDVKDASNSDIADSIFVDSNNSAISSAVVVTNVSDATKTVNMVGNQTNIFEPRVLETTDYTLAKISANISRMENTFKNFTADHSSSKWIFDQTLENYIFPRLSTGKSVVVQDIETVEEFFAFIKGGRGGNYRITRDLTFDLSNQERKIAERLENLSTENTPISGFIQGYGVGGSPITITVVYDGEAIPFLGYTAGLELSNINFEFVGNATSTQSDYFGLVAYKTVNSVFNKIKVVTMKNDNSYTITPNGHIAFGSFAGFSSNSTFKNIIINTNFNQDDYTLNGLNLYVGGLIGLADIRNNIESITAETNLVLSSNNGGSVCVGGLIGKAFGNLSLGAFGNSVNQVSGVFDLNFVAIVYAGGIIGFTDITTGSCSLNKVKTNFEMNIESTNHIYAGGVSGYTNRVSILDANSNVKMQLQGTQNIYAGGIGGKYENTISVETSINPIGTFTNCYATIDLQIENSSNSTCKNFVGGLFGQIYNNIEGTDASKLVETDIYKNNYANGKIVANVVNDEVQERTIYAGGLFGQIYNFDLANTQEYLSTLLKLSSSASDTIVILQNFAKTYLGGIAGYSSMNLYNLINYGMLSSTVDNQIYNENNSQCFVGGIVGSSKNIINHCLSLGAVFSYGVMTDNYQAVVGSLETNGTSAAVIDCYYNSDLTGVLQDKYITTSKNGNTNITHLKLEEVLFANGENSLWTFGNSLGEYKCLPYITELKDLMDISETQIVGGNITEVVKKKSNVWVKTVTYTTDLDLALNETSTPYKTILLTSNFEISNMNITNVARILGNGIKVTTSSYVFNQIPKNCLVSGIIVDATYNVNEDIYGALTCVNNGIVSNCVVGALPDYVKNSATIATKSANLHGKSIGLNDDVDKFSLTKQVDSSSNVYFGGLVGLNNNLVTNSWAYIDVDVEITGENANQCFIGNLVGNNLGTVNYSYAMGKINVTELPNNKTNVFVGGVLGYNANSVKDLIGMVDIRSESMVGGVIGGGNAKDGVIYAKDMSRSSGNVLQNIGTITAKSVTANDLLTRKMSDLGLNASIWGVNSSLNYGLPHLYTSYNVNFKNGNRQDVRFTGSGADISSPFEISNFALLIKFTKSEGKYFALTRDLSANSSIGTGSVTNSKLYGNGFIIFVENLNSLAYNANYSVFNVTLSGGTSAGILDSIMIKVSGDISNSRNGLSIAPLLFKNNGGQVVNCAVYGSLNVSNGSGNIGGLVAEHISGKISKCWTDVKMNVTKGAFNIGGLVGKMGANNSEPYLEASFASGSIMLTNCKNSMVGGLVGKVSGVIAIQSGTEMTYTSASTIDSCYYSGITKNGGTISEIRAESNYFGALIGAVGGSSEKNLTVDKLRLTNSYFAGKLRTYNSSYTKVVVGYVNGSVGSGILFDSVYIKSLQTEQWSAYLAHSATPTELNQIVSGLGDKFDYSDQVTKPYLKDVTPRDRFDRLTT